MGDGTIDAKASSLQDMEQLEIETLRLPLSDDRILDCKVGKTPIMVLQEHSHKHVGKTPSYEPVLHPDSTPSRPMYVMTVTLADGSGTATATDSIKQRAKHRAALNLLRELYPDRM